MCYVSTNMYKKIPLINKHSVGLKLSIRLKSIKIINNILFLVNFMANIINYDCVMKIRKLQYRLNSIR